MWRILSEITVYIYYMWRIYIYCATHTEISWESGRDNKILIIWQERNRKESEKVDMKDINNTKCNKWLFLNEECVSALLNTYEVKLKIISILHIFISRYVSI